MHAFPVLRAFSAHILYLVYRDVHVKSGRNVWVNGYCTWLADPRKRCNERQEGDGFRTHCNPLCNEDSPRPFGPPSSLNSGGGQSAPVAPFPEFSRSPIIQCHGPGPTTALNAETQTSFAESAHKDSTTPAEPSSLQHESREPGSSFLGPRDKPRTTSCHVLHDTNISVVPLADFSVTVYETCLEPDALQCSTELSASSGSLLMADSHRIPNVRLALSERSREPCFTCQHELYIY